MREVMKMWVREERKRVEPDIPNLFSTKPSENYSNSLKSNFTKLVKRAQNHLFGNRSIEFHNICLSF